VRITTPIPLLKDSLEILNWIQIRRTRRLLDRVNITINSYRVIKAVVPFRILLSVNRTIVFDTKEVARLFEDLTKRTSENLIRVLLLCKILPFSFK
jgi:hypothetical protein